MANTPRQSFGKYALSVLATVAIVSGITYAATTTISEVKTQTVSSGAIMDANWFQQVNDRLVALESGGAGAGGKQFGGSFEVKWVGNSNGTVSFGADRSAGPNCWQNNPITGSCNCPAGFVEMLVGMTFHYTQWDGAGFVCWK